MYNSNLGFISLVLLSLFNLITLMFVLKPDYLISILFLEKLLLFNPNFSPFLNLTNYFLTPKLNFEIITLFNPNLDSSLNLTTWFFDA